MFDNKTTLKQLHVHTAFSLVEFMQCFAKELHRGSHTKETQNVCPNIDNGLATILTVATLLR